MNWTEVILPILLACIAAIPGIVSLLKGRSKEKAETAATYIDSARDLVEEYRAKIVEIETSYRAKLEEIERTVEEQAELIRCQERKIEHQADKLALQQIELEALKGGQEEFRRGIVALCDQIRELGHEHVWEPEK